MSVLNDILDYSKIEAGKMVLRPTRFNVRHLANDVASAMQTRAATSGLEIIVRYDPELPEQLIGDESRLRQILNNLVGNAVKFTESGHVLLEVTGTVEDQKTKIRIGVSDTGVGIPADQLDRVFEKFEQADTTRTRSFDGTGLGLSICRELTTLMGGSISVESKVGEGSTFTVNLTLPIAEGLPERSNPPSHLFDGARVLVVDDNAVNRRVLDELLSAWTIESVSVSGAEDARAAVRAAIAEGRPFDAIVTDYQMPGEDGDGLIGSLQAEDLVDDKSVIMLTSVDTLETEPGLTKGAYTYQLVKPVRASQLMDALANTLADEGISERPGTPAFTDDEPTVIHTLRTSGSRMPKVLVAEDNAVNRLVIESLLRGHPFEVTFAENGQEALDMVAADRPDLVLMDVSMPQLDGLEATRQLRAIERAEGAGRLPIVGATAHVLESDRKACFDSGMDDYMTKPIRQAALFEMLEKWLGDARSKDRAA